MITRGPSVPQFFTSDGNPYPSLELAQRAELIQLFMAEKWPGECEAAEVAQKVVTRLFDNRDAVCTILRATGRRQRKAKTGNGVKRTRRVAAAKEAV